MSTSGVTTLTYTRDQYAKAALRKSQIISRFIAPEAEDITEAVEAINLLLGGISSSGDGAPNAKFWLRKTGALLLDKAKNRYQLGGTGADLAVDLDTLVINSILNPASLTAGTSSLDVVLSEKFTLSHSAAIHYNDTGIFTSSISNYSATGNLLDEPDFGATGNWTTGTGWTIAAGVAACDGTQSAVSNLSQTTILTSATRYLVLTNVSAYTSGTLTPIVGTVRGSGITESGWNLQFITAAGTDFTLEASDSVDFIGSVTSVVLIPVTATLTLTLANAFNRPATSAAEVFFYLTEIGKPIDIMTMSRRDRSGTNEDDQPITRLNEAQYQTIPDKDSVGDPTSYYFEDKLTYGHLYLDAQTNTVSDILVFKYTSQLQYFTASTDELDIPEVGREYIVYAAAKRLAGEHGKQWSDVNDQILNEAAMRFFLSKPETTRVIFEPDRVFDSGGNGGEFL